MKRSETDGHRWGIFKDREEITKEEREQAQKERKLEDDRMATKEITLPYKENLEEDQKLIEKVQEFFFDKTQVETMLNKTQEQNLLEK